MTPERIRSRYERVVMAYPAGAVVHMGDCRVFGLGLCVCGLLHDLTALGDSLAAERLYPTYLAEYGRHDTILRRLFEERRGTPA